MSIRASGALRRKDVLACNAGYDEVMKLRFRANSLRLRLNQREVSALADGEPLEESVQFPDGEALVYRLVPAPSPHYGATFSNGVISITVPSAHLKRWEREPEIGLYHQAGALAIAIEKDLECKDGPLEERDPYAFPRKTAC